MKRWLPSMTLRQLECFPAVVAEASFTRAASRMHVTQPSLSHHNRTLEIEIGGPLIERLPRAIRLTLAGRVFLPGGPCSGAVGARDAPGARRALARGRRAGDR